MCKRLYQKAIDTYGEDAQTVVAIEEMGELIQALTKTLRCQGDEDNLYEEIADVEIMLDQLKIMHDCTTQVAIHKCKKLDRLKRRLEGLE